MSYIDQTYDFKGNLDAPSRCGLKIARKPDGAIVIITELSEDNPGTSVTAYIVRLAELIVCDFGLDPEKTVFIEHYLDRGSKLDHYKESFDIVRLVWDGSKFADPDWERIDRARADEMLR